MKRSYKRWSARWSELDAIKSQLETKLEALTSERDDLAESLQNERENGGRETIRRIERERNVERAEWNAEKEVMKARIHDQNESLLASSQSITAANEELAQMRTTAELTVDSWKGEHARRVGVFATKYPFHNLNTFLLMRLVERSGVRIGGHHQPARAGAFRTERRSSRSYCSMGVSLCHARGQSRRARKRVTSFCQRKRRRET